MKSFSEKENSCLASFSSGGPYWHFTTAGKDTPILFNCVEDFVFAMNVIAQAAAMFPEVIVIAFTVMNNHFHFVLQGPRDRIEAFYRFIVKRLSKSANDLKDASVRIDPIIDLQSMRNRIIYDHRNGYVANPDFTPFSYPWSTGRYYFNDFPIAMDCSMLSSTITRQMFRGRTPAIPPMWKVIDGHIAPASFCATAFGMSLFRDAHHYFSMLYKEVEAYRDMAEELQDEEFLTDTELFNRLVPIIRDSFGVAAFRDLTKAQKIELARTMHYDFRSTNGQIRRVLGLTQYEVDSIFPMRK